MARLEADFKLFACSVLLCGGSVCILQAAACCRQESADVTRLEAHFKLSACLVLLCGGSVCI